MISQMTPPGRKPASRARSTTASVWPARTNTPPSRARSGNTCPERARSLGVQFAMDESRVAKHAIQFGERIGVAVRGGAEHHHAEHRSRRRGDAIFIRNKFQRYGATARSEGGVNFLKELFIG